MIFHPPPPGNAVLQSELPFAFFASRFTLLPRFFSVNLQEPPFVDLRPSCPYLRALHSAASSFDPLFFSRSLLVGTHELSEKLPPSVCYTSFFSSPYLRHMWPSPPVSPSPPTELLTQFKNTCFPCSARSGVSFFRAAAPVSRVSTPPCLWSCNGILEAPSPLFQNGLIPV